MQRYFAKEKNNNEFILVDDDMRHIKLVMRMKNNDEMIVVQNKIPYLCYLDNDKIYTEKLYKVSYENRKKSLKEKLSFFKL